MKPPVCKVFVIDDDASVRRGISLLMKSAGCLVESFSNAEEFLECNISPSAGCIILDIFMEGKSGLELQEDLVKKYPFLPIIYISGQGDIPMSVRAIRGGAINFLQKPVDDNDLLKAVEEAMLKSHSFLKQVREEDYYKSLFNTLTPRELQVFRQVVKGLLNKQIAAELNIAEHTVKLHRGKITDKLGVKSVAELVRIAEKLNIQ